MIGADAFNPALAQDVLVDLFKSRRRLAENLLLRHQLCVFLLRCMSHLWQIVLQKSEISGDKFLPRKPNRQRLLIDVASGPLAKSPLNFHQGDEVPHMFTRKPRPCDGG
jgi:hypothetical protein